jgi:hypothetical protein
MGFNGFEKRVKSLKWIQKKPFISIFYALAMCVWQFLLQYYNGFEFMRFFNEATDFGLWIVDFGLFSYDMESYHNIPKSEIHIPQS